MSLSINDLKKDSMFMFQGAPFKVLDIKHKKMARQGATVEVRCRNLVSKTIVVKTFFPSDKLENVDIEKRDMMFLYKNREGYCFVDPNDRSKRIMLPHKDIGEISGYLLPNTHVALEFFNDQVIKIEIPIKVDIEVVEAPPSIKGNTAQGGTKNVVVETGITVKTPLFINRGDVIRVHTQTGDYVERIKKSEQ